MKVHFREQYGTKGRQKTDFSKTKIKDFSCIKFSLNFFLTYMHNKLLKFSRLFLGEEFLYVTPIDQDTIVRVAIDGKKPSKGFFLFKLIQKTLLPQGNRHVCISLSHINMSLCFQ